MGWNDVPDYSTPSPDNLRHSFRYRSRAHQLTSCTFAMFPYHIVNHNQQNARGWFRFSNKIAGYCFKVGILRISYYPVFLT